jgi:hypothetical protein
VLGGADLGLFVAVEHHQLRGVGTQAGEHRHRPSLAKHRLGAEAGGRVGEVLETADDAHARRDGLAQHCLAEGPHRVEEHRRALGRHRRNQLELGEHHLLVAHLGQVAVEQGEVVLRVVDGRHPDEAVGVADPLEASQLPELGGTVHRYRD